MHAVIGRDRDARAKWMAAADLEAVVLHHVEFVGESIDRSVAKALVIVPAEAALIERDRAGEEHRKLTADDRGRMAFGGGITGQGGAVPMQADLDPLDLVGGEIVLAPHRNDRVKGRMSVAAAGIRFDA